MNFFENLYRQNPDPWQFASSPYEQGRYDRIIHFLEGRRYRRAFEPGCSIGVLTERLAPLCDSLAAIDISETAAAAARERCAGFENVEIRQGGLPEGIPDGKFDLILFSEIGYYFSQTELASLARLLIRRLETGGVFLASHWLGHSADHQLSGDEVHNVLQNCRELACDTSQRFDGFRIDRWIRLKDD